MEPRDEEHGSEMSVEERRVRLDEKRLSIDDSFAKKWLPTLVTLMAGLITAMITGLQLYKTSQATEQAGIAAQKKSELEWGFKVVEMYFTKRELFDVTTHPEQAGRNLRVLALVAPTSVGAVLLVEGSKIPPPSGGDDSKRLDSLAAVAEVQNALASARQSPLAPASDPKPSDFTVYVQYPEGQSDRAVRTQEFLVKLGYRVPGIDKVSKPPTSLELRFYRPDQRAYAETLARQLGSDLHLPSVAVLLPSSKQLPSGILEVWLPGS